LIEDLPTIFVPTGISAPPAVRDAEAEGGLTQGLEDPVGRLDVATFVQRLLDLRSTTLGYEAKLPSFVDKRVQQLRPEREPILGGP
jgi:hypothetical protein